MRKKQLWIEIGIVSFVILLMLWVFIPKFLDSQSITISSRYFPDIQMQYAVSNALKLRIGDPVTLYQAKTYTGDIRLGDCNDLTGLEYFPNLESLSIYSDTLTEINLSKLPNLVTLYFTGMNLKRLDTSNNPNLKYVTLTHNGAETPVDIPIFDFSRNIKIQKLTVRNFYLKEIDVSMLTDLNFLDCVNTFNFDPQNWTGIERGLTHLDVSHNPNLKTLNLSFNKLKELDLSNNPVLWELRCSYNELTSLDLTQNTRLRVLSCDYNRLEKLDISNCIGLDTVSCCSNKLQELNTLNHEFIKHLRCTNNQLTSLDLSFSQRLRTVDAIHNPLKALKLPNRIPFTKIKIDKDHLNT